MKHKDEVERYGVRRLEGSHRNRAWCDRFGARWHFAYGGWVRTPKGAEASVFGLTPTDRFGPFAAVGPVLVVDQIMDEVERYGVSGIPGGAEGISLSCAECAPGFCAASVDGYCVGGYGNPNDPTCHG